METLISIISFDEGDLGKILIVNGKRTLVCRDTEGRITLVYRKNRDTIGRLNFDESDPLVIHSKEEEGESGYWFRGVTSYYYEGEEIPGSYEFFDETLRESDL